MRVVLASDFFLPRFGGISVHLMHLGKYLVRLGYKVYVVTTAGCKSGLETFDGGFFVLRIPSPLYSNLVLPKRDLVEGLRLLFDLVDPDIVNVHHAFSPIAVSVPKALVGGVARVLTNHSVPIGYDVYKVHWARVARFLSMYTILRSIRSYHRFVAVSEIAADFIKNFVNKSVQIIPNGIDLDEFKGVGSKTDFGLGEDSNLFIMVGRGSLKKGYEFGLYVFKKVLKHEPNSFLFIAGPNGFVAKYIMAIAKILGIDGRVRVLGYLSRSELIKLYKAADVFLHFPWGGESFGIVLLEAMASETPIVASSGDGLKYILDKSGAGVAIGTYNPLDYVKAILRILRDDGFRENLVENGLKFVRKYDWSRLVKEVDRVYKLALEEVD